MFSSFFAKERTKLTKDVKTLMRVKTTSWKNRAQFDNIVKYMRGLHWCNY